MGRTAPDQIETYDVERVREDRAAAARDRDAAAVLAAAQRFEKMSASFVHVNGDSFSGGFAALRDDDTLSALVARADADMYERRRKL